MNKFTLTLALATGLTLGLAAPFAHADSMNQVVNLDIKNMSAADFNNLFAPDPNAPVMSSSFSYDGAANAGTVYSQLFDGKPGTAAAGLVGYAYQYALNNVSDSDGAPVDLKATSFKFNATPISGAQNPSAYAIQDGAIGAMPAPAPAASGQPILSPTSLKWEPTAGNGSLLATYFDQANQIPALQAGAHSATFVVLTNESQFAQKPVSILASDPTTTTNTVYTPLGGSIEPVPVPEPATILAWAGMMGAVALVRRVRKNRPHLA